MTLNPAALIFQPSRPAGPLPVDFGQQPVASSTVGGSSVPQRTKRPTPIPPRPILCRFFRMPAGCPQADDCRYVHEAEGSVGPLEPGKHQRLKRERIAAEKAALEREEVLKQLDKRQLTSCKFWVEGFCHRGDGCLFAHSLTPPTIDDILAGKGGDAAARVAASGDACSDASAEDPDDDSSDGPEPCAVCYERPQVYGLLECCSHAFCQTCLQSWRSNTGGESRDAAKTCPMCRKRSTFVTPSSRFFPDGAEKQALVDRYKQNMSKKECRYFAASLAEHPERAPKCPFRDICFYSHAHPFPISPRYRFGPLLPVLPRRSGGSVADAVRAFLRSLADDEPWPWRADEFAPEPDLGRRNTFSGRRAGPSDMRAIEAFGRDLERMNNAGDRPDLIDFGDDLMNYGSEDDY